MQQTGRTRTAAVNNLLRVELCRVVDAVMLPAVGLLSRCYAEVADYQPHMQPVVLCRVLHGRLHVITGAMNHAARVYRCKKRKRRTQVVAMAVGKCFEK